MRTLTLTLDLTLSDDAVDEEIPRQVESMLTVYRELGPIKDASATITR